jgi:predicted SprT family Zn-dependent metalloprotease
MTDMNVSKMRKHHNEVMKEAKRLYGKLPACELCFSTRGTRQLGNYHYNPRTKQHKITYQIKALDMYDEVINLQTVPHEIAHFVCEVKKIGKNHDKGWKEVCVKLGGDGKRCAPPPKRQPVVICTCGKKCEHMYNKNDLLNPFVKHKYLKRIK